MFPRSHVGLEVGPVVLLWHELLPHPAEVKEQKVHLRSLASRVFEAVAGHLSDPVRAQTEPLD